MELKLLTPVKIGRTELANRVVMAPLTRCRTAEPDNVPTALNAEYYAQRASAGLIISEAAQISRSAQGYAGSAGIYTDAQEAGWKKVVDAVHAGGGKISAQLWHVGRISHAYFQNGGAPVAPSAIPAEGAKCHIIRENGEHAFVPCDPPRALSIDEIGRIVGQYRDAAARAVRAGFDFVEEHAANGYLLQQFQATNTNRRTDRYGGSLENRARLTLEVLDAMLEAVRSNHPDLIALSVTMPQHLLVCRDLVNAIRREFPESRIAVGGKAFQSTHQIWKQWPIDFYVEDARELLQNVNTEMRSSTVLLRFQFRRVPV